MNPMISSCETLSIEFESQRMGFILRMIIPLSERLPRPG
jgi:hypothetical protein